MTTLVVILIVSIVIVLVLAILGIGKSSALEESVFELKSEKYKLEQENTRLKRSLKEVTSTWHDMKSNIPLNIEGKRGQGKSLVKSSD